MSKDYIERPGVLRQEDAVPILRPYLPGFLYDFHDSWEWVQQILDQEPERRAIFDASTVASMIYNRFSHLLYQRLSDDSNVGLRKSGRMTRAVIGQRIAVRFKKLRKTLGGHICSGNVKTNAQTKIYYQRGFDGFEGIDPTEVTFGYTTDETNTTVVGIYLACPISWHSNKWVIPLEGEDMSDMLPFAPPSSSDKIDDHAMFVLTPKSKKKGMESA